MPSHFPQSTRRGSSLPADESSRLSMIQRLQEDLKKERSVSHDRVSEVGDLLRRQRAQQDIVSALELQCIELRSENSRLKIRVCSFSDLPHRYSPPRLCLRPCPPPSRSPFLPLYTTLSPSPRIFLSFNLAPLSTRLTPSPSPQVDEGARLSDAQSSEVQRYKLLLEDAQQDLEARRSTILALRQAAAAASSHRLDSMAAASDSKQAERLLHTEALRRAATSISSLEAAAAHTAEQHAAQMAAVSERARLAEMQRDALRARMETTLKAKVNPKPSNRTTYAHAHAQARTHTHTQTYTLTSPLLRP